MSGLRWWLFKKLSALGWWICPEPHKSRLQRAMPTWDSLRPFLRALQQEEKR